MKRIFVIGLILCASVLQAQPIKPVTPNASKEATALLSYFQSLDGKHTLSGQHNFPVSGDKNSKFAARYIGKTPIVWSQDFGFAEKGDKDSYLARPAIVQEAIRQHQSGSIIALCWHAVPPTAEEPVTFQPVAGADPTKLASVQGKLSDEQFKSILTPGTKLNKQWAKQVDEIAIYLKQLQDAKVPVLWRPYHEMNGDWFWWGGRYEGKYTTAALYRQIFDRLVNHHKLNNLIWVWSIDRPSAPGREFVNYYPGTKYLDMLAIDIYGNDFNQKYYDDLLALSEGKPVALGEVGNPPAPEILASQPKWSYWVVWSGMAKGTSHADYENLKKDSHALFMEDPAFAEGTMAYRLACGFEPLSVYKKADFTGDWVLNEYESKVTGFGGAPYKLSIHQEKEVLKVKSTSTSEWTDDETTEQSLPLDGKDVHSTAFNNSPRVQNAHWSAHQDTLTIDSKVTFKFGDQPVNIKSKDEWHLEWMNTKLVIMQTADGFRGGPPRKSVMVYNRKE